jgi:hypothetical protein
MSSIALESLSGEPPVSLTLLQADGNSSLLTTEADLAARHWRKWLQSSRCHDGKLFRRQSMVDILCGAALSASTRGFSRYRPLWTDATFSVAAPGHQLAAFRRRAIALAAANLLMQTMLAALQISMPGNIRVSYDASGRMARLRVAHDGSYGVNVQQSKGFSVVRALADLLDGRLVCRANRKSGSIEIRFGA